jgi:competence protein ComEC
MLNNYDEKFNWLQKFIDSSSAAADRFMLFGYAQVMHKSAFDIRRLPLLLPVMAWTAGLALARTDALSIAPAAWLLAVLIVVLFTLHWRSAALICVLGALWGVADLLLDAGRMVVDDSWLGRKTKIHAHVDRVEQRPAYARLYLSHVLREDGEALSGNAILYLHGRRSEREQALAGHAVRAVVSWHAPHNHLNPGGFDYRAWCFDRHISLIGGVRGGLEVTDASMSWLQAARLRIRRASDHAGAQSGILRAVLLGERGQVSEVADALFAATGTSHLLAISGMHVGMVAAWAFALIYWLLTRREAWIVLVPVRGAALVAGLTAALAYATVAGWPLPAIRAALMLGAGVLAWLMASRSEPLNTLLASLGLVLLFDPAAVASLSLWLSFTATASILAGSLRPPGSGIKFSRAIRALFWASALATLATLPIILSTFGRIPVFALPANMLLTPLYGLIIMPLGLLAELTAVLGLHGIAGVLMEYSAVAVRLGLDALGWLSQLPGGQLWAIRLPLWAGLLYMAALSCAGWLLTRRKKIQACLLVSLLLAIYLTAALNEHDVKVPTWVAWDVGQGAASTLLLPGKQVIMIDAPGRRGSRFNGGATAASGLRSMGVTHIDVLALSHAQSDHLGGALSLMRNMNYIGQIWLPDVPDAHSDARVREIVSYARARGAIVRWLAQDDKVIIGSDEGDAEVQVMWPPRAFAPASENNTSLVLMVRLHQRARILLPGDIEAAAEKALIDRGVAPADAMLMPHHGSRTSSLLRFVQALRPSVAVAQSGFANHYGFPKDEVVQRYDAVGADVYNTANGAVLMRWTGKKGRPETAQWRGETGRRREITLQRVQSYL